MRADILDEAREVPGDLRIGRADSRRLAGATACAWPSLSIWTTQGVMVPRADCQTRPPARPPERTSEPKAISRQFLRLHAGRADALVPDLGGLLVGRLRLGRAAVADGWSSEHASFPFGEIDGSAAAAGCRRT